ncbi:MAG: Glycosyltransferase [uncultured bacterium]|nr:MAG: Glycosyltransferase [uncultured bacterium]
MNVLVNAISIVEGGGLVVLKNLLEEMSSFDQKIMWYVAATPNTLSQLSQSKTVQGLSYAWANKSPIHLLYWYEVVLPNLIRKKKIDMCFSQTNFLPRRKLSCPSVLLVQHAGYFSKEFEQLHVKASHNPLHHFIWKRKVRWVHSSIKRASAVTVQTQALADEIKKTKETKETKEKIWVIPHGSGLLKNVEGKSKEFPSDTVWRIGYITKYGVQKDFSSAFQAIKLLKDAGIPIKLVLTLGTDNAAFSNILSQINYYQIEDLIENHGEISDPNTLKKLYNSLHIFIFPSLCESFGFTLVEAMASALPVIVSNTKSNCEVAGIAKQTFKSENANELADQISMLIENRELYIAASKNSFERSQAFSWKHAAKDILDVMYRLRG